MQDNQMSWNLKGTGKLFWISLKQEIMEWQRHQLDHMQIICSLLQIDRQTCQHLPLSRCILFLMTNQQYKKPKVKYSILCILN